MTPNLAIHAALDALERPMMVAASEQLEEALHDGRTAMGAVRLAFADIGAAPLSGAGPIVVTSLLTDALALDRSLAGIETTWRARLTEAHGSRQTVHLCTVFRAVADRGRNGPMIERIIRLNLLAAELSRDYGAMIVDIDKTLAFIGADLLETDHRLGGRRAAEAAAHAVVTSLLSCDLGPDVSPEQQAAAVRRHGGLFELAGVVDRRLLSRAGVSQ